MVQKARSEPAGGSAGERFFVAYYRVSTDSQGASGLGIDAQKAAVAAYIAPSGGTLIHEFEEVETGKRNNRPQLLAALALCKSQHAILIVAKLDRLARNAAFLLNVAEGTGEGGVVFCDLPQLPSGPAGKFVLTMMAGVAEFEAGLISQRTKAAMDALKARGVKLGNPNLLAHGAGPARRRAARTKAREVIPYIRAARKAGCTTLTQVAEALTNRGVRTPGGKIVWGVEQVRRVLKRQGP